MNAHIVQMMKCIVDGMSQGELRSTPNICFVGAHNILSCPTVSMWQSNRDNQRAYICLAEKTCWHMIYKYYLYNKQDV